MSSFDKSQLRKKTKKKTKKKKKKMMMMMMMTIATKTTATRSERALSAPEAARVNWGFICGEAV